jgi:hypothetical protein
MLFFCRAHDGNRSNPAPEVMRIKHTGRVGIATSNPSYQLHVNGSFAATSKAFLIDHPSPNKKGWKLRHSCVEHDGPGATLYQRKVVCPKGATQVELPAYVEHLCKDIMCFCSSVGHFGAAYAEVVGATLHIHTNKAGTYNFLMMGTRKDPCATDCFNGCEYEEAKEVVVEEETSEM